MHQSQQNKLYPINNKQNIMSTATRLLLRNNISIIPTAIQNNIKPINLFITLSLNILFITIICLFIALDYSF
jgi:hypothetical protein